jgi:hypothetical protein
MKHIQQIIEAHGGLAAVQKSYLRIENPPFMRLVIEVVGQIFPNGACEVSVAHYGEQNGDAMRDPELTFFVVPSEDGAWQWKPLTFLNDYVGLYQVAAEYDQFGKIRVRDAKLSKELSEFAEQWDRNVKEQGFMDAFHRQQACTRHGAQIGATSAVS